MPHATLNKHQLYYETMGQGHPLILIPGYAVDHTIFLLVQELLAKHFRLFLLDNRASGQSECPKDSFTIDDMADDVLALCDYFQIEKPHILGHSMGGCIAQSIAYRYPDRIGKAILSQTVIKTPPVPTKVLQTALEMREEGMPLIRIWEVMMPWLLSNQFLDNSFKCAFLLELMKRNPFPQTMEGQKKQAEALFKFDSSKWVGKITVPVQVHAGEEDLLFSLPNVQQLAVNIPDAKLHVFKKMGHSSMLEIPEEYGNVVNEFLTR